MADKGSTRCAPSSKPPVAGNPSSVTAYGCARQAALQIERPEVSANARSAKPNQYVDPCRRLARTSPLPQPRRSLISDQILDPDDPKRLRS